MRDHFRPFAVLCALSVFALGCSSDDSSSKPEDDAPEAIDPDGWPGDEQTPPTGSAEGIAAWLEKGDYKSWACETVEHPQLKVSPHGFNRVCSNGVAAAFDGGVDDERPVRTASVKEIYDDASTLIGYATSLKVAARSAGGGNWYWYERVPLDSAPVANGLGGSGPATTGCVGCHVGAGADETHAVTNSSDYVYLQVAP